MLYTLEIFSTDSVAAYGIQAGTNLTGSDNPINQAQNGDAFSWQGYGNQARVALTFEEPNASLTVNDADGVLSSNPISGSTVTDQKLAEDTTIDDETYAANDTTTLWETPAPTYVRLEYTVTLYDDAGTEYTMAGISIISGYEVSVVGVTFIGATPDPATTLYYVYGTSVFNDTNPELQLPAVICFSDDCLILTDRGECAAGDILPGQLVWTRDCGFQPVLWAGKRHLDGEELQGRPNLRPIRIRAGALGTDHPVRDLIVSPQHRILLRSVIAGRMFGIDEVLVPAKKLLSLDGVEVAKDLTEITYVHLLFDRHQIVMSDGQESESLYVGPEAMKSLTHEAREEILDLFPELKNRQKPVPAARLLIKGKGATRLVERHIRNRKPLVSEALQATAVRDRQPAGAPRRIAPSNRCEAVGSARSGRMA